MVKVENLYNFGFKTILKYENPTSAKNSPLPKNAEYEHKIHLKRLN